MIIDELLALVDEMRASGVHIGANTPMANYATLADEIRRLRELERQLVIETARSIAFEKRIAELERALAWYADKINYRAIDAGNMAVYTPAIHTDRGERARKALGGE